MDSANHIDFSLEIVSCLPEQLHLLPTHVINNYSYCTLYLDNMEDWSAYPGGIHMTIANNVSDNENVSEQI